MISPLEILRSDWSQWNSTGITKLWIGLGPVLLPYNGEGGDARLYKVRVAAIDRVGCHDYVSIMGSEYVQAQHSELRFCKHANRSVTSHMLQSDSKSKIGLQSDLPS